MILFQPLGFSKNKINFAYFRNRIRSFLTIQKYIQREGNNFSSFLFSFWKASFFKGFQNGSWTNFFALDDHNRISFLCDCHCEDEAQVFFYLTKNRSRQIWLGIVSYFFMVLILWFDMNSIFGKKCFRRQIEDFESQEEEKNVLAFMTSIHHRGLH